MGAGVDPELCAPSECCRPAAIRQAEQSPSFVPRTVSEPHCSHRVISMLDPRSHTSRSGPGVSDVSRKHRACLSDILVFCTAAFLPFGAKRFSVESFWVKVFTDYFRETGRPLRGFFRFSPKVPETAAGSPHPRLRNRPAFDGFRPATAAGIENASDERPS